MCNRRTFSSILCLPPFHRHMWCNSDMPRCSGGALCELTRFFRSDAQSSSVSCSRPQTCSSKHNSTTCIWRYLRSGNLQLCTWFLGCWQRRWAPDLYRLCWASKFIAARPSEAWAIVASSFVAWAVSVRLEEQPCHFGAYPQQLPWLRPHLSLSVFEHSYLFLIYLYY